MGAGNIHRNRSLRTLLAGLAVLALVNLAGSRYFERWDLTAEKRYTLDPSTRELLRDLDREITIEVYLEGSDLPAGIKKLRNSTRELLNEFRALSGGLIDYRFLDIYAIDDATEREATERALIESGLYPTRLEVQQQAGMTEKRIYPGALLGNGERAVAVTILENQMSYSTQDVLNNSYNFLEYKFANAVKKLMLSRPYRVAVSSGHGEPANPRLSDLLQTLSSQDFLVQRIDLARQPLLESGADVLIVPKPQRAFGEAEKFAIDQYVMHGGRVLWMLDGAVGDLDSFRVAPAYLATGRSLNLDDLLFRYGVRVNADLVQDLYCNPVPVTEDVGGQARTELYPWVFHPVIHTPDDHPVTKNLDPVLAEFASSIDTVRVPGVRKTVLLATSEFSRVSSVPVTLELALATVEPQPEFFDRMDVPVGVLLEGTFRSLYENRVPSAGRDMLAQAGLEFRSESKPGRMLVFSDGDLGVNDIDPSGAPLPLGYYRFTQETFANKDLLLNGIEYLLDQEGLIRSRTKETRMQLLDKQLVAEKLGMWQFLNIAGPLAFMLAVGGWIRYRRQRRYAGPQNT